MTDDWDDWGETAVAPASGGADTTDNSGYQGGGGRTGGGRGCFKCGEEGHMSRECPKGGGGGGSRACHKCGEEGHMSRECPKGGGGGGSRACHKCGEEGHMSRECPQGGGGGGSRACHKCGEEGHMSRECPQGGGGGGSRACHKCGEEGHMSRECPQGGGGGGSRACHKCGEEGHMSRECPQGGGGSSRACHKCKQEGHMARECPEAGGDGNSTAVGGATGCRRCGQEGHFAKDCTNEPIEGAAEKKERYEQPTMPEGEAIFTEHQETHTGSGINFSKYESIPFQVIGENAPASIKAFEDMKLRSLILDNVRKCGYTKPTPIQQHASPILMAKRDVMACAQTGSGKTCGYLLPIIQDLMSDNDLTPSGTSPATPEALIVAPTRELAQQIGKESNAYANQSIVRSKVLYGGTTLFSARNQLAAGVNVLVATPGRLLQLVNDSTVSLKKVKYFILDEADRMLDMGFMPDIQKIIEQLPTKENRVSGMFSATFPDEVQQTAKTLLKDDYLFVTIGMVGGACSDVQQEFQQIDRKEKRDKLMEILKGLTPEDKTIIFCGSKKVADFLATYLSTQPGISATSIHGDRLQAQRELALREFTSGKRSILVATAVAARGLDIPKVSLVINYDLPKDVDEYVHRIGRTGRVGNTGKAMSFFTAENDAELAPRLVGIIESCGQIPPDWLKAYGSVEFGGLDGAPAAGGAQELDDW